MNFEEQAEELRERIDDLSDLATQATTAGRMMGDAFDLMEQALLEAHPMEHPSERCRICFRRRAAIGTVTTATEIITRAIEKRQS